MGRSILVHSGVSKCSTPGFLFPGNCPDSSLLLQQGGAVPIHSSGHVNGLLWRKGVCLGWTVSPLERSHSAPKLLARCACLDGTPAGTLRPPWGCSRAHLSRNLENKFSHIEKNVLFEQKYSQSVTVTGTISILV